MNEPVWKSVDLGSVIGPHGPAGPEGPVGTTFTPSVSAEGVISWTNDGEKLNPPSVNIKGPKGDTGDPAPAEQIATEVEAWLEENITNPDSPPLDRSLSASSAAAPADMVGNLKSEINSIGLSVVNGELCITYEEVSA